MKKETLVRDAFEDQHKWCAKLGSPFTSILLQGLGVVLDQTTKSGKFILDWQGQPDAMGDSIPLRLAGALHALVMSGKAPELAKLYPPNPLPDHSTLNMVAMKTIKKHDDEIFSFLQFAPQTNEIARSAILYLGMMYIAKKTGLPLALYELGASAGLNLFPDKFSYQFGKTQLGNIKSRVILSPSMNEASLPEIQPNIISRIGCDKNPLDITNIEHRERLKSYVWPDQQQRKIRIIEAIKIALENPPMLDKGDAADWVENNIKNNAAKGVTRVIFHSVAFQYFSIQSQNRIKQHLETIGENALNDTPLAWLSFEDDGRGNKYLTLKLWANGKKTTVLAKADAHCSEIEWRA